MSRRGARAGVSWGRDAGVLARAVLPRPGLWLAALGALGRMARHGWWRRPPFVPLPGEDYWRFRMETVYGSADGPSRHDERADADVTLTPGDVVAFLRWCQSTRPGRG